MGGWVGGGGGSINHLNPPSLSSLCLNCDTWIETFKILVKDISSAVITLFLLKFPLQILRRTKVSAFF